MFEICLEKSFCFLLQRIFSFTIRKLSNNFRLLQVHIAELLENMFYSIRAISCFMYSGFMYSGFMQILNYRVIILPERGFVKFWNMEFLTLAEFLDANSLEHKLQAQINAALDAADNSEDAVKTKQESISTRIGNMGVCWQHIYKKREPVQTLL